MTAGGKLQENPTLYIACLKRAIPVIITQMHNPFTSYYIENLLCCMEVFKYICSLLVAKIFVMQRNLFCGLSLYSSTVFEIPTLPPAVLPENLVSATLTIIFTYH